VSKQSQHSTPHTPDSHATSSREKDSTLVFSSDTGFDETLATFAAASTLFILEASFFERELTDKHLNLEEATAPDPTGRKPTRAMLTHFYAEWDDVNFEKELVY
jgi:ribonuclease BN (tRNA processing enzyme)